MSLENEILKVTGGARYRRGDLHIHSYGSGGSSDVTDTKMTPARIVALAVKHNIEILSITDHNSIGNVEEAISCASDKSVLVIPGVELSTVQGHLLIYFETYSQLNKFFGKLSFSEDENTCTNTIPQCLQIADGYDGFGVLAHIEQDKGFEKVVSGYGASKEEIFKCRNLLGLEITDADNDHWFSSRDDDVNRKNIYKVWRDAHSREDEGELAKILSSDSHSIDRLFKNAKSKQRLTRFKMEELTFHSLKIALNDSFSRIRLEDLIPVSVPKFIGMKLEGGFLKDQTIQFSSNLTCIIGGRGAGKSTLLESLRVCSGNRGRTDLVDSEVGADRISLVYEDEAGVRQELVRDKSMAVRNLTDSEEGLTTISIESYGQGETADTLQHCDKDPSILLRFLDVFCDLGGLEREEEQVQDELLDNQKSIEKLSLEIKAIPDVVKAKKNAELQVAALKEKDGKKAVEYEEALAKEKVIRETLASKLERFCYAITEGLNGQDLQDSISEVELSSLLVGKKQFQEIKKIVNTFVNQVSQTAKEVHKVGAKANSDIDTQIQTWKSKENETLKKIDKIRSDLTKKGIKLDLKYIRKVTEDVSRFDQQLKELKLKKQQLKEIEVERKKLVRKRFGIRSNIFLIRQSVAESLNASLKSTIDDFQVRIKYREGLCSPEFKDILKNVNGWRTAQVPKASIIASSVSIPDFLKALETDDVSIITNLRDKDNNKVFTASEAKQVFSKMREAEVLFMMQRCPFEDKPEIFVAKTVAQGSGGHRVRTWNFTKLSLGQQQAILLSILLFSKSKSPLLVDQPEDNLDSQFIYKTIVKTLRKIKEQRQVIIVTHNANIAVLGDADLILPLRSTSEFSQIMDRGSIDTEDTKKITCAILEGSEKAFLKRSRIYGY